MDTVNEFEKAFAQIQNAFDENTLKEFYDSKYEDLYQYHFVLGVWLRNTILHKDTMIYNTLLRAGISRSDDMSSFLIRVFYVYLHAINQKPNSTPTAAEPRI